MSRGWKVVVDGSEVEADEVKIVHPNFGTFRYGLVPNASYDSWSFHENGGGGSVIIPYIKFNSGFVWVGVIEQMRIHQDREKPVLNVPRGFLRPDQDHFATANIEVAEELGLTEHVVQEITELSGAPGNPNSTFFETWGTKPDGSPEGIRFYSLRLDERILEPPGSRIRPGLLRVDAASNAAKLAEQILGSRFIPISVASELSDMMTLAAIARLRNMLDELGRVQ